MEPAVRVATPQLVSLLKQLGLSTFTDVVCQLGVDTPGDLGLLVEADLLHVGIPVVTARKLLAAAPDLSSKAGTAEVPAQPDRAVELRKQIQKEEEIKQLESRLASLRNGQQPQRTNALIPTLQGNPIISTLTSGNAMVPPWPAMYSNHASQPPKLNQQALMLALGLMSSQM